MIHNASLIHDDVIDQPNFRRGKPSVNVVWSQKKVRLTLRLAKVQAALVEFQVEWISNSPDSLSIYSISFLTTATKQTLRIGVPSKINIENRCSIVRKASQTEESSGVFFVNNSIGYRTPLNAELSVSIRLHVHLGHVDVSRDAPWISIIFSSIVVRSFVRSLIDKVYWNSLSPSLEGG